MTHSRKRVVTRGPAPEEADAAAVLIHGRGGSPEGMLTLAREISVDGFAWIAPHADGSTWYPRGFMEPMERNEPWLSSALEWIGQIVAGLEGKGIGPDRVAFVGFSQGACLSAEFVARNPRRYGAVGVLSGGVVGPPGSDFEGRYGIPDSADGADGVDGKAGEASEGPLSGTPIFLGCSDRDPHIPLERVRESTRIFEALGADVTEVVYPGMPHTVNEDEIERVKALLAKLI